MPDVSPFAGLVYDSAVAGPLDRLTAPPYDTISVARLREHLAASPFNIARVDLAKGSDDPDRADDRYRRAGRLLSDWEARGVLVREPEPTYHAYEMVFGLDGEPRTIRGLLVAMTLEAWGGNVIPHERTMPGPVDDRLRLLRATRTHLSAVYGTVEGPCEPLRRLLDATTAGPAASEAVDEQGVRHRLWPVPASPDVGAWLALEPLLIADGHHRYTTALHYRDERRAAQGPGPWDRVLTLVVDEAVERPPVLPFHRIQTSGTASPRGDVVDGLDEALALLSDDGPAVASVVRHGEDVRYRVLALRGEPPAVRALHEEILDALAPQGSLRFVPDAPVADRAVRSGEAVAAYLLPPTTPERIREVIRRGDRLPEKSTYFWPKPRTGMIMMPLDDADPDRAGAGRAVVTPPSPAPAS